MKAYRCNGYRFCEKLSPEAEAALAAEVQRQRPGFLDRMKGKDEGWGLHEGSRFLDDSSVSLRVASVYSSAEVLADPLHAAEDGLLECAKADHWYTYEKDWG